MHSYTVIVGVLTARRDGVAFNSIKERYKMGVKGIYLMERMSKGSYRLVLDGPSLGSDHL